MNNGVVVLSGKADTLSSHLRALEDARAVDGVRRVASEIRSPDELGDQEIWSDAAAPANAKNSAADTWTTMKVKVRLMAEPWALPAQDQRGYARRDRDAIRDREYRAG